MYIPVDTYEEDTFNEESVVDEEQPIPSVKEDTQQLVTETEVLNECIPVPETTAAVTTTTPATVSATNVVTNKSPKRNSSSTPSRTRKRQKLHPLHHRRYERTCLLTFSIIHHSYSFSYIIPLP